MSADVELKLTRCTLRPWRSGDEPSLVRYADNRNVWRNLKDRFPSPYTAADAREWIAHAGPQAPPTSLAIVVDGAAVGGVGIELGTDVFRRGIATEALRAMTAYAFERFDICRLEAGVFDWNPASARVLEKSGYVLEGRARLGVIKDGRMGDRLLYALIRP